MKIRSFFSAAALAICLPCMGLATELPQYINVEADTIEGSLPLFAESLARLATGADTTVRILHIGDSHIQAEFVTDRLRALLQERYGDAGRGLMVPLRLAGTNQSHNYSITCDKQPSVQTRLLKFPWPAPPGLTGISVICDDSACYTAKVPGKPFNSMEILTSEGVRAIPLETDADSASFHLAAGEALYGAYVENGQRGIVYSAIGNNGACYTDYSLIDGFPQQTAFFRPALIVLSMGTNEGFSKMTDEEIRASVVNLMRSLRAFNPQAEFLVLAPMECWRDFNKGVEGAEPDFRVNDRVAQARDIIVDAARNEGAALWNFHTIAGGDGAAAKWRESNLMNKDMIHLLKAGYEIQAELLFDAITK